MIQRPDRTQPVEIPGYQIERELGRGAMASVYLAVQLNLQRRIALKIMSPALANRAGFRERFLREARLVAQLDHPNIVTVFDVGVYRNHYYMAMRYVAGSPDRGGVTLRERISSGVSTADALQVVRQIAAALAAAHSHPQRIIHRDVKPANILFDESGNAVLSDFGIAKSLSTETVDNSHSAELTGVGHAIGTPAYMSPEQLRGQPADARSDLYSLGVVCFEMLAGRKPFAAEETFALAMMQVHDPVPQLPADCTPLQPLVDTLMAKQPEQRYANATTLLAALDALQSSNSGTNSATSNTLDRRAATPRPRKRRIDIGLALATLTGGGALLLLYLTVIGGTTAPPNTTCQERPLSDTQRATIAQLLAVAQLNLEVGRLVTPPISNAAYGFDQVRQINPCDAAAATGLAQIGKQLAATIRRGIDTGVDRRQLQQLADAGLRWTPEHPALLAVRKELSF